MSWVYLVVAGLCEIAWPVSLKLAQGIEQRLFGVTLAVGMALGGLLLWLGQKEIALGTAYAVWTGIGAAGSLLVGVWFFGDATSLGRYLGVTLITSGVVVLKLSHRSASHLSVIADSPPCCVVTAPLRKRRTS